MEVITIKPKKKSKSSNKEDISKLNETNKVTDKETPKYDDYEVSDKEINDLLDSIGFEEE